MSLPCKIVRSRRKTAAFTVNRAGEVELRIPLWVSDRDAQRIIAESIHQIDALLARWQKKQAAKPVYREEDIPRLKALAAEILPSRLAQWAKIMGLTPASVKITSAKTRFGSCNSRGSICFSCFLMLYPDAAIDYVIVHELAHLRYLNHSPDFYRLVAYYLPDYRAREAILKGRIH